MACWGELSARLKVECRASRQSLKSSTCRARPHYVPYYQSLMPKRWIMPFFQNIFPFYRNKKMKTAVPSIWILRHNVLLTSSITSADILNVSYPISIQKRAPHKALYKSECQKLFHITQCSGLADPQVFGPLGSGSVIIWTDPDPSVNKQKMI